MLLHVVFCLTIGVRAAAEEDSGIPVGHQKPFGSHRPPDVLVEETEIIPDPWTFWENYVEPEVPLLLRGAARKSPAFTLWTEEYMRTHYGSLEIRLEGKNEDSSRIPIGSEGLGRDKIGSYLEHYHDRDSYVVSQLPEPMYRDVTVLSCMTCGNIGRRIIEVDLWMSSGDSRSALHKDAFNQMNCLMNGTKQWKLVHKKYEQYIHKTVEPGREIGGRSDINVLSVDLLTYPNIAKVHYSDITVHAGDCLFLPKDYYHQVTSFNSMNVAVSLLFSRIQRFEDDGCDQEINKHIPLNEMEVLWSWSGHGIMSMGNMDVWSLRTNYIKIAKAHGGFLTRAILLEEYRLLFPDRVWETYRHLIVQAWEVLDPKIKGHLTVDDLLSLDTPTLVEHALRADVCDPSNTLEFEYHYINEEDIRYLLYSLSEHEGDIITKASIIESYTSDYGGTEKVALELWKNLKSVNPEFITSKELSSNIDSALTKWSSYMPHTFDPEMDQSRKSMLWRDEFDHPNKYDITKDEL